MRPGNRMTFGFASVPRPRVRAAGRRGGGQVTAPVLLTSISSFSRTAAYLRTQGTVPMKAESAETFPFSAMGLRYGTAPTCTRVPPLLIQYAKGRTATTLQFQILCVSLLLLHDNEPHRVRCTTGHEPAGLTAGSNFDVVKVGYAQRSLTKRLASKVQSTWVFSTSISEPPPFHDRPFTAQLSAELELPVVHVQYTRTVEERGYRIAEEYKTLLGLSTPQLDEMLEYLRLWSLLRQCCGVQMSAEERTRLIGLPFVPANRSATAPRFAAFNSTPACPADISSVERQLLVSSVYRKFAHHVAAIGAVSNVDGKLDGSYCKRTNAAIAGQRLAMNMCPRADGAAATKCRPKY